MHSAPYNQTSILIIHQLNGNANPLPPSRPANFLTYIYFVELYEKKK